MPLGSEVEQVRCVARGSGGGSLLGNLRGCAQENWWVEKCWAWPSAYGSASRAAGGGAGTMSSVPALCPCTLTNKGPQRTKGPSMNKGSSFPHS